MKMLFTARERISKSLDKDKAKVCYDSAEQEVSDAFPF